MKNQLLTIRETADYLRLTQNWVYKLVGEGRLPALRFNGSWRIQSEDLERFGRDNAEEIARKNNGNGKRGLGENGS